MDVIAHIRTDFGSKFGVPRQSGLVEDLIGKIIFEKEYRNPDAIRGIEEFSHLWLIWGFSEIKQKAWTPTVRPPRLGGNTRVGVFATRSPYRPNGLGLSSVKLVRTEHDAECGPVLYVSGIDMVDNTPVYDIKPYLPYTDCHADAVGGFADSVLGYSVEVEIPAEIRKNADSEIIKSLIEVLANDPRPSYQDDADRVYGMEFAGYSVKFRAEDGVISVLELSRLQGQ